MNRLKVSLIRAAKDFFVRAASSDAASASSSSGSLAPGLPSVPSHTKPLSLPALSQHNGRFMSQPFGWASLLCTSGCACAIGTLGGVAYARHPDQALKWTPLHSFAERLNQGGSTVPRQQEGWSQEQVQRVERANSPPALPLLGPHFIADAAAKAAPAVVNVTVKPAPGALAQTSSSSGSGFIMEPRGLVVTNAHVVEDALDKKAPASSPTRGAQPVIVSLHDGRSFEGRICSLDRESDLALVRIQSAEALPVAELGSSAGLRVGEWILALGSPLHLHNTVTAGIVSCRERKAVELGLAPSACEYIQMDVAINQGNSGGPVVNLAGQVVGISHMKALMSDGVSFAIPIDAAKRVIRQLEAEGRVRRPHVGMKLLELNAANVAQLRARDDTFPGVSAGILVPSVTPGSPAAHAGLRAGDVIIGFANGNTQRHQLTTSALVRALGDHVGLPMHLQVLRPSSGTPLALEVIPREAVPSDHPCIGGLWDWQVNSSS